MVNGLYGQWLDSGSYVDEEELHLCLSDAPTQTLAWAKTKAQAPEVVRLGPQPSRRPIRFWMRENLVVPAHGEQT